MVRPVRDSRWRWLRWPQQDETVADLRLLGLSRYAAWMLARTVRREVTATVCRLLPGVERSTGVRWLFVMETFLTPLAVKLVERFEPEIPERHRSSAAFAVGLLFPATAELRRRHDASHPEAPLASCPPTTTVPEPTAELVEFRSVGAELADQIFGHYYSLPKRQNSRRIIASGIRNVVPDPVDLPWGAWTALAAAAALYLHRDTLPEPGRDADRRRDGAARDRGRFANHAFILGQSLVLHTALGLVELTGDSFE